MHGGRPNHLYLFCIDDHSILDLTAQADPHMSLDYPCIIPASGHQIAFSFQTELLYAHRPETTLLRLNSAIASVGTSCTFYTVAKWDLSLWSTW